MPIVRLLGPTPRFEIDGILLEVGGPSVELSQEQLERAQASGGEFKLTKIMLQVGGLEPEEEQAADAPQKEDR